MKTRMMTTTAPTRMTMCACITLVVWAWAVAQGFTATRLLCSPSTGRQTAGRWGGSRTRAPANRPCEYDAPVWHDASEATGGESTGQEPSRV